MTNTDVPLFAGEISSSVCAETAVECDSMTAPVIPGLARFSRLSALLERQPKAWLGFEAIFLVLVIGFSDFVTGYEVSVVLFYSVPILMMVRFADKESAILIALFSAIVWWWADEASGHHYTSIWHQVWETGVRVAYFLLFVVGGSAIKSRIELLGHAQKLEQEIIRISEHERHRIGQDLHDGLCQYYAAVGCSAGSIKSRLERAGSPEAMAVQELQKLILDGVQQTRSLARGLSPVQDDEWGLPSALTELAASTGRLLNVHCTFSSNASTAPIRNDCSTHLFRLAQEAVSNAIRHGGATELEIRLNFSPDMLILSVADNGTGFGSVRSDHNGLGLTIMRYRARQMGGRMTFENNAGGGATVTCQLPLASVSNAL